MNNVELRGINHLRGRIVVAVGKATCEMLVNTRREELKTHKRTILDLAYRSYAELLLYTLFGGSFEILMDTTAKCICKKTTEKY